MSESGGLVQTRLFNVGCRTGPLEINAPLIAKYITMNLVGAGLIYGLDAYVQKTEFVK
jgi:hypothetical protein